MNSIICQFSTFDTCTIYGLPFRSIIWEVLSLRSNIDEISRFLINNARFHPDTLHNVTFYSVTIKDVMININARYYLLIKSGEVSPLNKLQILK